MKFKFSKIILTICMVFTASISCFAQTYQCEGMIDRTSYSGSFNPNDKAPNAQRCNHLKGYTLSYDSCMRELSFDTKFYNAYKKLYSEGKCYLPQKKTITYNGVSCTAEFLDRQEIRMFNISGGIMLDEKHSQCYEQLKKQIYKEYPALKNIGK